MAIELAEADLSKGLAAIAAGLDEVFAAGVDPVDSPGAIGLVEELETLGRRLDAAKVELVDAIDRHGLHRVDGHHSARPWSARSRSCPDRRPPPGPRRRKR